jgi:hypothetical protein
VAVESYRGWPDEFAASRMRKAVGNAADVACLEAGRRSHQSQSLLKKPLRAAAGGVIVVANAAVASHVPVPGFQELSITLGGHTMLSAGPESNEPG